MNASLSKADWFFGLLAVAGLAWFIAAASLFGLLVFVVGSSWLITHTPDGWQ